MRIRIRAIPHTVLVNDSARELRVAYPSTPPLFTTKKLLITPPSNQDKEQHYLPSLISVAVSGSSGAAALPFQPDSIRLCYSWHGRFGTVRQSGRIHRAGHAGQSDQIRRAGHALCSSSISGSIIALLRPAADASSLHSWLHVHAAAQSPFCGSTMSIATF